MALSREYVLREYLEILEKFEQIVKENRERAAKFENQVNRTLEKLDELEERTERLLAIHQAIKAINESERVLKALPHVSTFKEAAAKSQARREVAIKTKLHNPHR